MDTRLKAEIETAIQRVFNRNCEHNNTQDSLIHPKLIVQMTNAAEQVFDTAMDAQEYYIKETC